MKKRILLLLLLMFLSISGCSDSSGGSDGVAGASALVSSQDEAAGTNCTYGGIRVNIGVDLNGDDILGMDEITDTKYVCNGNQGSKGEPGDNGSSPLITIMSILISTMAMMQ